MAVSKRALPGYLYVGDEDGYVIHHAKWQVRRGRRPSANLFTIRNPRKALRAAKVVRKLPSPMVEAVLDGGRYLSERDAYWIVRTPENHRSDVRCAIIFIVVTSETVTEVRERLESELPRVLNHVCASDVTCTEYGRVAGTQRDLALQLGTPVTMGGHKVSVRMPTEWGEVAVPY